MMKSRTVKTSRKWQFLSLLVLSTIAAASEHSGVSAPTINALKLPSITNGTSYPRKSKRKRKPKETETVARSTVNKLPIMHIHMTKKRMIISEGQTTAIVSSSIKKERSENPKVKQSAGKRSSKEGGSRESASLRRIQREWRDAAKLGIAYDWIHSKTIGKGNGNNYVRIGPFGNNLLRWHFSVSGPPSSDFANGIYHGRVLLPKDYPGSPPRIQVLTPSGRFLPGQDICLSASSFHPESWTPRWTVLSLVDALRLHMLTQANEIGGMNSTPQERRALATASRKWGVGRINHAIMIEEGVFPMEEEDVEIYQQSTTPINDIKGNQPQSGNAHPPVRQTPEAAPVAKQQIPRQAGVITQFCMAVVEVLRSPARMLALLLLTMFIILNK